MAIDNGNPQKTSEPKPGKRLALLDGVKVLDLTSFLAGPFGSMILADMGATVLKVERMRGDSTRGNPPYYLNDDSAYFLSINRNKESIAIDLKTPKGREIVLKLVAESDIVLDNLRVNQREALGLSYAELKKVNPRIVSCSLTGFGSDGPYAQRPAYDIIVEALAGVMSLTGPEGGPSVRAGVPIGDITAGLYMTIGALAGLQHRQSTGEGTHIDVSMLDSQVSLLSYLAQYYFTGDLVATHQGRAHVSIPTYNTFAAQDGTEIVVAANTEAMWKSLCEVLGLDELPEDPRFLRNPIRLKHRDELISILQAKISERESGELFEALVAAGVPAAPINNIEEALHNPQVLHRDMVVTAPHRDGGEFTTLGVPIKTKGVEGSGFSSPPELGGQTTAVLKRLGYTDTQIDELSSDGIVVVGKKS